MCLQYGVHRCLPSKVVHILSLVPLTVGNERFWYRPVAIALHSSVRWFTPTMPCRLGPVTDTLELVSSMLQGLRNQQVIIQLLLLLMVSNGDRMY